ncbi:hypothetical protein EUX53_13175 [Pseudomonas orientalis]|nr:hypothetical protein EUX53_13175 [Pseudomonas orientalis]
MIIRAGLVACLGIEIHCGEGPSVGASLLAKNLQAPRSFKKHAYSLKFFASKLAPTVAIRASPLPWDWCRVLE